MNNYKLKTHAKDLRKQSTDAEKHLWYALKDRRLLRYKFRRQHIIEPYIVDFVCLRKKLIIELDGGQHAEAKKYDDRRTAYLEKMGYVVLRFWNDEALQQTDSVLGVILLALQG